MRIVILPALLLLPVGAAAVELPADLPKRKPGLWELRTSVAEMGGMGPTVHQCIDASTDDLLAQRAQSSECARLAVRREGARIAVDAVCTVEGSTATMRGEFSGDFAQSYRGELHTRYEPPLHGIQVATMTQEGRWLGPCKAGQKPGDVQMQGMQGPGGFNLDQLRRNLPQVPAR